MNESTNTPVVMNFAGTDPSGGAGLQADIETLISMGCHAAPVVTAVTVQDTQQLFHYQAMEPTLVIEQARAVLEDIPVAAFKIGMVGSVENAEAIAFFKEAGMKVDDDQRRVHIGSNLVHDSLATTPSLIKMYDCSGGSEYLVGGDEVHFDSGSARIWVFPPTPIWD